MPWQRPSLGCRQLTYQCLRKAWTFDFFGPSAESASAQPSVQPTPQAATTAGVYMSNSLNYGLLQKTFSEGCTLVETKKYICAYIRIENTSCATQNKADILPVYFQTKMCSLHSNLSCRLAYMSHARLCTTTVKEVPKQDVDWTLGHAPCVLRLHVLAHVPCSFSKLQ